MSNFVLHSLFELVLEFLELELPCALLDNSVPLLKFDVAVLAALHTRKLIALVLEPLSNFTFDFAHPLHEFGDKTAQILCLVSDFRALSDKIQNCLPLLGKIFHFLKNKFLIDCALDQVRPHDADNLRQQSVGEVHCADKLVSTCLCQVELPRRVVLMGHIVLLVPCKQPCRRVFVLLFGGHALLNCFLDLPFLLHVLTLSQPESVDFRGCLFSATQDFSFNDPCTVQLLIYPVRNFDFVVLRNALWISQSHCHNFVDLL